MPLACTRTRTCPGAGRGSGRVRSSQGRSNSVITAAFMVRLPFERRRAVRDEDVVGERSDGGDGRSCPLLAGSCEEATDVLGRAGAEALLEVAREVRGALVPDAGGGLAGARAATDEQQAGLLQ